MIRCQLGQYGGGGFLDPATAGRPTNAWPQRRIFDDEAYLEAIPEMFAYLREHLGFGVKLTHDVHEHLLPHNAVTLAKLLEPYRLYFLEDALPPSRLPTSAPSASNARRRRRWASSSSTPTNGCR